LFGKAVSFKDLECVFRLYPSCEAQAAYYIFICGLFSLCLIVYITLNTTLFWKKKISRKCAFKFLLQSLFEMYLTKRRTADVL